LILTIPAPAGSVPERVSEEIMVRGVLAVLLGTALGGAVPMASLVAAPVAAAAGDRTEALLRELSNAAGPSGYEEDVRRIMVREMQPYGRISYDGLGSVIAENGAAGPRIMLDAHMDELGGLVRRITKEGFLSMQMLGGWLDQALPDQRWVILGSKGPVLAVTGIRDIHYMPAEERTKVIPRDQIFLDIGASSEADAARLGVEPGDPVVPLSPFETLNASGDYIGKAFDDRVGCAVVVEALRRLAQGGHPNQLFVAATVQEEIGLRGAQASAALIHPDVAIAIEGGVTGDAPGGHAEESQVRLGQGPAMFLYDSSELPSRRLVELTRETARAAGVPLQYDVAQGYGDDSAEIQRANGGAPTINLVVPVRYTHAHNGVMNRADFDRLVDLTVALIRRLDAPTVARLRDFTPTP
jgi:putative aminopeptidase FrvX